MSTKAAAVQAAIDGVKAFPWKWVGLGILGYGAYYVADRALRNQKAKDQDRRITTNQSSPQEIARLIHREGATNLFAWPRQLYVDEDKMLALATQIYNFNEVRIAYEQLYRPRKLLDDLEAWLSPADFENFLNIAQKTK